MNTRVVNVLSARPDPIVLPYPTGAHSPMPRTGNTSVFNILRQLKKYLRQLRRREGDRASGSISRRPALLRRRVARLLAILAPGRQCTWALRASGVLLLAASGLKAQPEITSFSPATNAINVALNANIAVSFSETMSSATLTAAHVRIFGSQAGFLSTTGVLSGNPLRIFNPNDDFHPGELISVSVTGATNTSGTMLAAPLVFQFRARASEGSGIFSSSDFGSGVSTRVAIGDLDGDGNLDALIANYDQPQDIWLGNGDGTFTTATFGSGNSQDVALGDLDSDGDLDAIVGNYNQAQEIWLNNGDGTFSSTAFGAGSTMDVALGDLDGDGDLDAILTSNAGSSNEIWLNNGDGTFASATFGTGNSRQVGIGDLDGDGDLDAIIANQNQPQDIWLNNGDGTFTSSTFGSGNSRGLVIGDLDGDGDIDAIVVNYTAHEIWLGNDDGTFSSSAFGAGQSGGATLGDLDRDGDLDAIIANTGGEAQEIWLNNGDGSFVSSAFDNGNSLGAALGDLDNDGDLDAIIVNSGQSNRIWLNFNGPRVTALSPSTNATSASLDANITITFSETMSAATLTAGNIRIYSNLRGLLSTKGSFSGNPVLSFNPTADFSAGERIDVSVTERTSSSTGASLADPLVFQFNAPVSDGNAVFASSNFGGQSTFDVNVGDLDGDGNLDAVLSNFIGPHDVWLGNGDGSFSSSAFGGSVQSDGNALGDLDGDGDLDVIIATVSTGREIWLNNGDGTFTSSTFDGGGNVGKVALGDLDGDGDLDAVFGGTGSSRERLWLNNGDATFTASTFGDTQNSQDIAVGDLDNDGDLDLIVGNYGTDRILLNNGDASFSDAGFGGSNTLGVALGDLNGDNFLDAVFARSTAAAAIWLNNGDGSFSSAGFGASGSRSVSIGDLDADGDNDVIMARNGAEEIWLNNGDGTFSSSNFGAGGTIASALGDLDNDGDLDYIAGNYLGAAEQIWLNGVAPVLTGLDPASNAIDVPRDSDISISFDRAMDVASLTSASIPTHANLIVYGMQTGHLTTTAALSFTSGNTRVIIDPAADFKAGEEIIVTVTGAASSVGTPITRATVFGFRAAISGDGEAVFAIGSFGGRTSFDVELGDLDGDGNLDAVFGESYGSQVWLGNGDGSFSSSLFGAGVKSGLGLGDLDGDGDLDVIVAGFNSHSIWNNNGDATFSSIAFGIDNAKDAAIGDLDGDGDLDAVVPVAGGGSGAPNQIWLNNGDATFTSATFGSGNSNKAALGDLDSDGDLDAIIANYDQGASIWLNNGNGTFSSAAFGPDRSQDVAIGDLDGDGDLDAVLAHYGRAQSIWLGNDDGSFFSSSFGPNQGEAVDLGDLDGDGDLDAIIAQTFGSPQSVWLNNGNANFKSSARGAGRSFGVALGDLDNDGDLDAIVANALNEADEIWINNSVPRIVALAPATNATAAPRDAEIRIDFSESLSPATATTATIPTHANLIVYGMQSGHLTTNASVTFANGNRTIFVDPAADFKAGEEMLVTVTGAANTVGQPMTSAVVYGFRAAASAGSAQFHSTSFGGRTSFDVELGDLDGDGDLDVVFAENYGSQVWLGNGDGSFASSLFGAGVKSGLGLGDLDGDGDLDAIVAGFNSHSIWNNNGDATFTSSAFGSDNGKDAAIGDLDGDGDLDAIVTMAAGGSGAPNQIWLNNGDASFSSSAFGTGNSSKAALGDLDGDGDLDAIIANYDQGASVWLNNGKASFTSSAFGADRSQDVAIGDLDGDGDLDAVLAHYGRAQSIWLNQGDGSFTSASFGPNQGEAIDLGDLDGDDDLDAIVGQTFGSPQSIWLNNGNGSFSSSTLGAGSSFGVAIGDLDGDNDLDAIIANALNQADEVWINLQAPQITSLTPGCAIAGPDALPLTINGRDLAVTGAQVSLLDGNGATSGTLDLTTTPAGLRQLSTTIPAGFAATSGTLTLELFTPLGSSSTTLTLHPPITVSGATAACPGDIVTYTTSPPDGAATQVWTVEGGAVLSGQGTEALEVLWQGATNASVTVVRTFGSGCTTAALLALGEVSAVEARLDFARTTTGAHVTLAVLNNDVGAGLQVSALTDPDKGTAALNNGIVTYTPDAGFTGLEIFRYTIENANSCISTGAIVIAVEGPEAVVNADFIELKRNRVNGVRGLRGAYAIAVSPDGNFVYAAARREHSISTFRRDVTSGSLSYIGRVRNGSAGVSGLKYVSDLAFSPDGLQLYAAGYGNNSVVVFAVDQSSGALSFVERIKQGQSSGGLTVDGLKRPRAVAVSHDGKNLYAAGFVSDAIAVFRRLADGTLSYLESHKDGVNGVDGLDGAIDLVVSPDGANVYAAGYRDKSLVVFARDPGDGGLNFVERFRDGVNGIDGLAGATGVAISPDSRQVYSSARNDRAIALFSRNTSTGSLSWIERYKDGVNGVDGINGAFNLAVSPDGRQLWAVGTSEDALAHFERRTTSGTLEYVGRLRDGAGGVNGLDQAQALALSPGSEHIYVAAFRDDALSVFLRNRAPRAVDDVAGSLLVATSHVITLLSNDSDPDGHSLVISAATNATLGSLSIDHGGMTLTYDAGAVPGADSFSYTVDDGHGGSSTAMVSVNLVLIKRGASDSSHPALAADEVNNTLGITPNPVKEQARIMIRLERSAHVRIAVVDLNGRVVAHISDAELRAGVHTINWRGRGANAARLAAGSYVLTLEEVNKQGSVLRRALPFVILP